MDKVDIVRVLLLGMVSPGISYQIERSLVGSTMSPCQNSLDIVNDLCGDTKTKVHNNSFDDGVSYASYLNATV